MELAFLSTSELGIWLFLQFVETHDVVRLGEAIAPSMQLRTFIPHSFLQRREFLTPVRTVRAQVVPGVATSSGRAEV